MKEVSLDRVTAWGIGW